MSGDTDTSVDVSYEVVLSKEAKISEIFLPVDHIALISILEDNDLGRLIYVLAQIFSNFALDCFDLYLRLVHGYGEIIDDNASQCRMGVTARRRTSQIVFQAVATMEKLADVTSNVLHEDKAATWMVINELGDIEHKFV